ncbi:MAG: helix-turn-helix domain-containing protein [Geminicoccaceae bacterium]
MTESPPSFPRSPCPIVSALDLVGDSWTLVIVRDLAMGKARFAQFLQSPEGITTSILADRLRRLEAAGVVSRTAYQERPVRHAYELTAKGRALIPVLQALARWSGTWTPGCWTPPARFWDLPS